MGSCGGGGGSGCVGGAKLDVTEPDAVGRRRGLGAGSRMMACVVQPGCPSTVCKNKTITLHLAAPAGAGPPG